MRIISKFIKLFCDDIGSSRRDTKATNDINKIEHKKQRANSPGAVLSERIDHGIDSAGEVAVVRVNLEQTHIRPFETIHAEQRADDSGVDAATDPHKQVVAVLQQEQTVRGESDAVKKSCQGSNWNTKHKTGLTGLPILDHSQYPS